MNIFAFCFLVAFVAVTSAENAPVLMYFKNYQADNTLTVGQTLSKSDFSAFLDKIKSSADIIYVNDLSSEELRILLNRQELPTKNIHFEPSVESPYEFLTNYLEKNPKIKSNILTVNSLSQALADFSTKIASSDSDAIILTNSEKRLSRSRRQANSSNSTIPFQYVFGTNCSAMFTQVYLRDQSSAIQTTGNIYLNITNSSFTCSDTSSVLTLNFPGNAVIFGRNVTKLDLTFLAPNNSQYWNVNNNASVITTNNGQYGVYYYGAPYGMATPLTYSFVCTKTYFQLFNNTLSSQPLLKVMLYFDNLQIQPFRTAINGSDYKFGKVNYCQGFFSSGIWMAITSSLILTAILAFGVSFLFGINTMDKFDDPKGKPLSIALEK